MQGQPHGRISIWFFIGILLFAYGILITGVGVYEIFVPPVHKVVLQSLHANAWWGILLLVMGAFYSLRYAPGRRR